MSNYNETAKHGQKSLTETELVALENEGRNVKTLADKLAEKGRERGFMETQSPNYKIAKICILTICGFFILCAWPFVFDLFLGHFFYLPEPAAVGLAGTLTFSFLVVIEWLRFRNAEKMLFEHFFQKHVSKNRIGYALFFTTVTATLSILGIPKLIDLYHPAPIAETFAAKNPQDVREIYEPQIEASATAAQNYFNASSWEGKLTPNGRKNYNERLAATQTLQKAMAEALVRLESNNDAAKSEVITTNQAAIDAHDKKASGFVWTLVFLIGAMEVLFWFAFHFKERFERLAFVELERTGQLPKMNGSGGNGGKKPETIQNGASVIQMPTIFPKNGSVIQNEKVVLQTTKESVRELVTYWGRCVHAGLNGEEETVLRNMKTIDRIGAELRQHGFVIEMDRQNSMLIIFSPNIESGEEDTLKREGRTVAVIRSVKDRVTEKAAAA